MSLIEKFIRRPVLTTAFGAFIVILGLFGFAQMPLRFLPKIDQALIQVNTVYPGADSSIVKSFVTSKIQTAIVGVDGIDYLTSSNTNGLSNIKIYLTPGTNIDAALASIREKINGIQGSLPSEIKTPIVSKENTDNKAMFILSFTSQTLSRAEVAEFLRNNIAPQIEAIDGVSEAQVWGDQSVMQIWLNPTSLAAYNLSSQEVVNALHSQNVLATPGKTQGNYFNYILNATTALHTADEFNNIVIKTVNNVPIYLRDVGEATIGAENDEFTVYYDGTPASMIGVLTLPTSNPLVVVDAILKNLPVITKKLPADIKMHIVLNRTNYIRASLHEVMWTLTESIFIVVCVIFIFLGNIRAALVPAVTIPLSLIGIGFFADLMGYSINTITLLAMVLAVGLVVDDAIVVVENIVRNLSESVAAMDSSIIATTEIIVPIIAMTITLVAVYLPIGFIGGLIGQLFKEFAFTLAGSVMLSGALALTLSPMMSARLIKLEQQQGKFARTVEGIMHQWQEYYRLFLMRAFQFKKWMIMLWLFIMLLMVVFYVYTPSELAPMENQGFLLATGSAPPNANRSYLEHYALDSHQIYNKFKIIHHYATILSTDNGYTSFLIADTSDPKQASILTATSQLQAALTEVPGLDLRVIPPGSFASTGPAIQFVLQTTGDYKSLYHAAKQIELKAMQTGNFMYLYDDLNYGKAQANMIINQQAASAANISMSDIANAISSLMSNREVQQYSANDKSYNVVIKTLSQYQLNPEDLENIPIENANHTTVPLSSVASLTYSVVPDALNQFQKMNSVTLMGAMTPGRSLSLGLSQLNQLASSVIPKNMSIDYAGNSRQFLQEGHRMLGIFSLAIIIIFLVMSIQFESYKDSFIILFGSVPMALFSALLPLIFGLGSVNIFTQIGLLTLVGLISKHGILITRFANEIKKSQSIDKQSAVIEAAVLRFRPILMTTAAILFGSLPLINAVGAGSESRHAIGVVIGFGMSLGTVLTLLLLPVIYTVFSNDIRELKKN